VLWTAVMVLLCMVPMLGAFLVWVPAALYLLVTGHWVSALVLTAWGALVIGTVDNVLRPLLVGSRTRMHELVVFFAVLGGIEVFGILGIVTGPAVAAVAVALYQVWKQARAGGGGAGETTSVVVAPVAAVPVAAAPASQAPAASA
jgi:predicted PurR-regulated permease PerM